MAIFKKSSFPPAQSECPSGWDQFEGSCYILGQAGMDFYDAEDACEYNDGYLAEISSEGENNFVKELLGEDASDEETSAWIGVKQNFRGAWVYRNSRDKVSYTDWATPSRRQAWLTSKCAILGKDQNWAWKEKDCGEEISSRTFVCERDPQEVECFEGSCYELLSRQSYDIEDAREMCEDRGGYVVEIGTQEEQNFVKNFLSKADVPKSAFSGNKNVWLGASDEDTEGDFYWKNGGSAVGKFPGWAGGEPNNAGPQDREEDCTALDGNNDWKWNDIMCAGVDDNAVLCERPEVSPISG